MNKKLLSATALIAIILIAAVAISSLSVKSRISDISSSSSTVNNLADSTNENISTSSQKFSCPDGFVETGLVSVGGHVDMTCVPKSSVMGDYPIGDGSQNYSITGYYFPYERPIYTYIGSSGEPILATTTCSAFTITKGNADFIQVFKNIVKNGNTVNRLDDNGNLVLNINLNNISVEQQNLISKSAVKRPVELVVKINASEGKDAEYCESSIVISSVK